MKAGLFVDCGIAATGQDPTAEPNPSWGEPVEWESQEGRQWKGHQLSSGLPAIHL